MKLNTILVTVFISFFKYYYSLKTSKIRCAIVYSRTDVIMQDVSLEQIKTGNTF